MLWDRQCDRFQLGQWLKGRIYERRSDLSPDGKYLIYFAMNGRWQSEACGAWTAISQAPYLKAIAIFPKGIVGMGVVCGRAKPPTGSTTATTATRYCGILRQSVATPPTPQPAIMATTSVSASITLDFYAMVGNWSIAYSSANGKPNISLKNRSATVGYCAKSPMPRLMHRRGKAVIGMNIHWLTELPMPRSAIPNGSGPTSMANG